MSLVKNPSVTARKLSANRRNGQRSRGAVTPEGKRRAAAARLRHGFYSQKWEEAMVALGEDPREFRDLLESLVDTWQPANGYELALVKRLARTLWRMERSDRIQESVGLQKIEKAGEIHAQLRGAVLAQGAKKLVPMRALAASAARPDFVTQDSDLELYGEAFGGNLQHAGAVEILSLLKRLGEDADEDSAEDSEEPQAGRDAAVESHPRELLRQELLQALAQHITILEKGLAYSPEHLRLPDSQYEHDALMAPSDATAALMLRFEDSCLRQAWRITNLLLKMKKERSERQAE